MAVERRLVDDLHVRFVRVESRRRRLEEDRAERERRLRLAAVRRELAGMAPGERAAAVAILRDAVARRLLELPAKERAEERVRVPSLEPEPSWPAEVSAFLRPPQPRTRKNGHRTRCRCSACVGEVW